MATSVLIIGTVCGMWLKAYIMRVSPPADGKARSTSRRLFSSDIVALAALGASKYPFAWCCSTLSASHLYYSDAEYRQTKLVTGGLAAYAV